LAVLLVLALVVAPDAVQAKKPVKPPPVPEPDPDPAILYTALVGKGKDVGLKTMVMNADGSNQTELSIGASSASWSPDGSQIVYLGWDEDDQRAIFIADADGTDSHKVITVGIVLGRPVWSPQEVPGIGGDVYRIAYTERVAGEDHHDLYIVDLAGEEDPIRLTETSTLMEREPEWSPDASKIVFKVNDFEDLDANRDLWGLYDCAEETYDLQHHGGGLEGLDVYFPSWARTDENLILWSAWDGDQYDIWLVDLTDQSNPVQLTNTSDVSEWYPCWSPDDSKIVFSRDKQAGKNWSRSIAVMDADGSDVEVLAEDAWDPDWMR
jgi:Tol biopolymer transport system component